MTEITYACRPPVLPLRIVGEEETKQCLDALNRLFRNNTRLTRQEWGRALFTIMDIYQVYSDAQLARIILNDETRVRRWHKELESFEVQDECAYRAFLDLIMRKMSSDLAELQKKSSDTLACEPNLTRDDQEDDGQDSSGRVTVAGVTVSADYLDCSPLSLKGAEELSDKAKKVLEQLSTLRELLMYNFQPERPTTNISHRMRGELKNQKALTGSSVRVCREIVLWLRYGLDCTYTGRVLNLY